MQCREFEQRLNDVLDARGEPADDPWLIAHALQCAPCNVLLAGQDTLFTGLRQSAAPSLPPRFARTIVVAVANPTAYDRPRPASKAILAAATLLASAAAALLAVSLVWYARSREPFPGGDQSLAATQAKTSSVRGRPVGGGSFALTQRDWLVEAPRLPDHLRDSLDELAVTFPESVQRLGEVERLAPGIRPLRLSFALLWDTLFRALPGVPGDTSHPAESGPRTEGRSSLAVTDQLRLA